MLWLHFQYGLKQANWILPFDLSQQFLSVFRPVFLEMISSFHQPFDCQLSCDLLVNFWPTAHVPCLLGQSSKFWTSLNLSLFKPKHQRFIFSANFKPFCPTRRESVCVQSWVSNDAEILFIDTQLKINTFFSVPAAVGKNNKNIINVCKLNNNMEIKSL